MSDKTTGLHRKFDVKRTDGSSEPGGKHEHCAYFVLDLNHDKYAIPALEAYKDACYPEHRKLSEDLRHIVAQAKANWIRPGHFDHLEPAPKEIPQHAARALLLACQLWDQGFTDGEDFTHDQFMRWMNANRKAARDAIALVSESLTASALAGRGEGRA